VSSLDLRTTEVSWCDVTAAPESPEYLQSVVIATSTSNCCSERTIEVSKAVTMRPSPVIILHYRPQRCRLFHRRI